MATAIKSPSMKLMKNPAKKQEPVEMPETADAAKLGLVATNEEVTAEQAEVKAKKIKESLESSDAFVKTAKELDGLKAEKAIPLIIELNDEAERNTFRMGGVLSKIQSQGWFMDQGHENFRSFVEKEIGMEYRVALYHVDNYNYLTKSGVPWEKVAHIGWSKLILIAKYLTLDNVDQWVGVAESLKGVQLKEYIKETTKGSSASISPGEVSSNVKSTVTMTFKLHSDQKSVIREALDKAKHETGTEFDAVALEAIALDFLGGESKLKAIPSLKDIMKSKSAEEVLEAFGEAFPNVELQATMP